MFKDDFNEFAKLLDESYALISQGTKTLAPGSKALFFAAMQTYPIETVRKAFQAHLLDPVAGKFCPVPAHLNAQIMAMSGGDGRPDPDEAWAIALKAADEAETVIWTAEMQEAFEICRPVLESGRGDQIGARKSFLGAYSRLVTEARRTGLPVKWSPSLGTDPLKRQIAVREAGNAGRLPAPQVLAICPPKVEACDIDMGKLQQVKELCATLVPASIKAEQRRQAELQEQRDAEAAKKREIAERVQNYTHAECA